MLVHVTDNNVRVSGREKIKERYIYSPVLLKLLMI